MTPPIVKRFFISFAQNQWLGLLIFLLGVGGALVFAFQPPPPRPPLTYKAIGQLSFKTPPPAFTSTGTELQQLGRAINREILLSPWVLQRVAQRLRLTTEQIIEIRDKKLNFQFPEPSKDKNQAVSTTAQVITLEYTDPESPTRATLILEALMKEMVEYSRWLNTSQLRGRIEALSGRLDQVKGALEAAEKRFYNYLSKAGTDLLAVQDGSLFSGITSSQQRQRELQLALEEIEGQIQSLEEQLGLNPKQAYTSSALSADPIIANLRARILDNELQLERIRQDLRPEHPQIKQLLKEQQVNEKLLQQRAQEIIGKDGVLTPLPSTIRKESNLDPARQQLATQLITLQTQREGLLKQLESLVRTEQELREQYERFPDKQIQQARLVQDVEFQRVLYQNILGTLVDAQAAEAETTSSLAVAQAPFVTEQLAYNPKRVNRILIVGAGAGVGLVAGLGAIFLLALLDDRLHTPQELRDVLADREVPLLGQLPILFVQTEELPILIEADSIYLPFYERFRSNIRRLKPESSRVVLITSITDEEGKTVSAYNLAIASAHAGKRTLLVEADLRSSSHAHLLEITLEPEASIEPLRYYAARNEAISLVPAIENLYILPSPGPQRQAAAIIESSELQLLLKDARGRFDLVIIDTPSLSKCNDALLLEPLTDGVVLVTRPGVTRSSFLGETIDQFVEADVPLLGAVINCVETLNPTPALLPRETVAQAEASEEVAESELTSKV